MRVILPDSTELELPDGASGLDAARAIGPKLAEQAVLVRANGSVRDLRLPLADGEQIQILTTRDREDPDALWVLRHSAAHLLAEAARRLHPGTKVAIGPPIENGFYYDFEFPEPVGGGDSGAPGGGVPPRDRRGARLGGLGGEPGRGAPLLRGGGRAVQGRARRLCGGGHLLLQAGRLRRPLPRPAPPERGADQGGEAPLARGSLLAGRRAASAAHEGVRDGLLRPEGPGGAPAPARGGQAPRPSPPGEGPRPLRLLRARARDAVLARARDGRVERPRGPAPAREPAAGLRGGAHAAPLRFRPLAHLGALGEVPGAHVPARDRGAGLRPEADELSGPLPPVLARPPQLPGPAAADRGGGRPPPQRALGRPPRAPARTPLRPGRRAHLLHARASPGRAARVPRLCLLPLRPVRAGHARRALAASGEPARDGR